MLVTVAKDLLHVRAWLELVSQIAARGEAAYLADPMLQEAGDALMAKVGEAANRLPEVKRPRQMEFSGKARSVIENSSFTSTTRWTGS